MRLMQHQYKLAHPHMSLYISQHQQTSALVHIRHISTYTSVHHQHISMYISVHQYALGNTVWICTPRRFMRDTRPPYAGPVRGICHMRGRARHMSYAERICRHMSYAPRVLLNPSLAEPGSCRPLGRHMWRAQCVGVNKRQPDS